MDVRVLVVGGEYGNGVYGYAPAYDYAFLISNTNLTLSGSSGSRGFSQAGDGFVFGGVIGYSDTLYYSDGSGETTVAYADNGDYLFEPHSFVQLGDNSVFLDYYSSPVYVTDGNGPPIALLPSSGHTAFGTIGDTLFAQVGSDFYRVESNLQTTVIYDDDANTTGVVIGNVDEGYFFEFQGNLWVRGSGSSNLANDFYRYDINTGNWAEMNIAENSGGDSLYFSFNMVGDSQFFGWINTADGFELHVSNGANGNWAQVKDIKPGSSSSYSGADYSGMINNTLVFVADDGGADDVELWVSDGTDLGTFAISGTGTTIGAFSSFSNFVSNGSLVFFTAYGPTGFGLYVTDGTAAGTELLLDPNSNRLYVREVTPDGIYFVSDAGDASELWFSDGTSAGTQVVANFSPGDYDSNTTLGFVDFVTLQAENLPVNEVSGTEDANILTGIDLSDSLSGLGGNDTLNGQRGDDTLNGGAGKDRVFGESGGDELYGGDAADKLYGGKGADKLFGGNGNDRLEGGNGADRLFGGKGADKLEGGKGNDFLVGSAGSDDFIFKNSAGHDTIKGFDATDNKEDIVLSAVSAILNFADLAANHMTQVGDDVVIDDGANLVITLLDVELSDLGKADFIF